MTAACPVRHTYYRLRRVLMHTLDLPRHVVRPSARLEDLVPYEQRRAVWRALRREGFGLPSLGLSPRVGLWYFLLKSWLFLGDVLLWAQGFLPKIIVLPLSVASWLIARKYAVHISCGPVTVGHAVLYFTHLKGEDVRNYPWSHEEISVKVRLIISECLGVHMDQVTPDTRWEDLTGC